MTPEVAISLGWGGRAMGLPPSWHGCWSSSWIAPLGSISEPVERRRRSRTSHRPDPAAAEDKVKASVSAPITLNTLYSGSQWPYITSVWSWLDNGPCMFLCVYTSHQLRSKHFSQGCICVEKTRTHTQCLGLRWCARSWLYTCTDIKEQHKSDLGHPVHAS